MDLDVGIARVIDDFYTGTAAAACGGTTTIVDHMAFGPAGCSPWHQVREYHRLADGNAAVDYGFHGVLQHVNDDVLKVNVFNTLIRHNDEYIYFRTDHHWTALGAYYAYETFCRMADFEPVPLEEFEERDMGGLGIYMVKK